MSQPMNNRIRIALLLAVTALSAALAAPFRMDRALQGRVTSDGATRVIIQTAAPLTGADAQSMEQKGVRSLGRIGSGQTYKATLSRDALASLVQDGRVSRISIDAAVRPDVAVSQQAMLDRNVAWTGSVSSSIGFDGRGVGVAVIDSGIARVKALQGVISAVYDAATDTVLPPAMSEDAYGHGTHVASIIAGSNPGLGFVGIAPGARLINCKVLDAEGNGYTSDVIRALDWCVANSARYNIRVVNLSLSHPPYESWATDPLCLAVQRAVNAGLVVVTSAGNWGAEGYATIGCPGNSPFAITVGASNTRGTATRSDDVVASYSSRGPTFGDLVVKPDVVAPGNRIVALSAPGSTLYNSPFTILSGWTQNSATLLELSGTSMAAPMVSGVAALMLSRDGAIGPGEIKARLMVTASRLDGDIWTRGAGQVEPFAAVWSGVSSDSPVKAVSPACVPDASGAWRLVDPVSNESIVWGDRVVWGDAPLPIDAGTLTSEETICGSSVILDAGTDPVGRVVWGDRVVQGDQVVFGDRVVWGDAPPPLPGDSVLLYGE